MINHLQQRKLTRFFNGLDIGAKAYLSEEDIYMITLRMTEVKGVAEGDDLWNELKANIDVIWNNARKYGVSGDPDKVYLLDWLNQMNVILEDEELREPYLEKISVDVFELFREPDGNMYLENYQKLMGCFGIDEVLSTWSFHKMDVKKSGYFDRDKYRNLVREFYLAKEKKSVGNYFFGPF